MFRWHFDSLSVFFSTSLEETHSGGDLPPTICSWDRLPPCHTAIKENKKRRVVVNKEVTRC